LLQKTLLIDFPQIFAFETKDYIAIWIRVFIY